MPAFPGPVMAAKVRTEVTQAGALGDPYGSGVRTVWWVYGVGPVKVVFEHAGGATRRSRRRCSTSTNLTPKAPPPDTRWFPLVKGATRDYRWTNSKHMKKPSVQEFTVDEVVERLGAVRRQARLRARSSVAGAYGFTLARRRAHEPLGDDEVGDARRSCRRSGRRRCRRTRAATS